MRHSSMLKRSSCQYAKTTWFIFFVLLSLLLYSTSSAGGEDVDLYELLGVTKTATIQEIKRAYRRKALDTHPDKQLYRKNNNSDNNDSNNNNNNNNTENNTITPEQAAEEFRTIVNAFEILSDETSRRNYDRYGNVNGRGRTAANGNPRWNVKVKFKPGGSGQQQYYGRRYSTTNSKNMNEKYRLDVQQARSRVMHITSLQQLQTIMTDDKKDGKLERNLLLVFVTPKEIETIVDDEMIYPYPFAHMSSQGLWWEDMLQTCKVRYHNNGNEELMKFFNIPHGDILRSQKQPIFIFGRRGQPMTSSTYVKEHFTRLQTSNYDTFFRWVWEQLKVEITFVNHHTHAIEMLWLNQGKIKLYETIEPNQSTNTNSMLSHEWWFRDTRVDTFANSPNRNVYSPESMVAIYKITNDTSPQTITIEPKNCFDLSGHCNRWKRRGACQRNQQFTKEYCRLSCDFCSEEDDAMQIKEIVRKTNEEKRQRQQQQRQQQQRSSWGHEF